MQSLSLVFIGLIRVNFYIDFIAKAFFFKAY